MMAVEVLATVYIGNIINVKSPEYEIEVFPNGFIAHNEFGRITGIGSDYDAFEIPRGKFKEIRLSKEQFLMPGFVDCHIHAPQVPNIGLGLDKPLLEWLNAYTFPLEAKYNNKDFAQEVYSKVVESTLRRGTTLAAYFGTNHRKSTVILAKEASRQGQRALVGKVCSNQYSPDFYKETYEESVSETLEFIADCKELTLVKPIITPRFAISCDGNLLKSLGKIANEHNLPIQTHISENLKEIELVREMYGKSYAEVYDDAQLLTNRTILAHGIYLEDAELDLIQTRGSAVAHCPASNTLLSSGLCDVARLLKAGIKVGLGTDVSGGNSLSIQDAILRALGASHHIAFQKRAACASSDYRPLNFDRAVFLGTLGGAQALGLDHITGSFEINKEFDAILVDTSRHPLLNFNCESGANKQDKKRVLEMLQRFIYTGDDRNILKVFVAGRQVIG